MLEGDAYISLSLELDLFFLRIMKEHSLFIKAALPARNVSLSETAGYYLRQFDALLLEAAELADGALGAEALASRQFVTPFTPDAERLTQFYTGILIDQEPTRRESALRPSGAEPAQPDLEQRVNDLNQRAMAAVTGLAAFKGRLLADVLACRLFTSIYPLMLDHMHREAVYFGGSLMKLQSRASTPKEKAEADEPVFWNRIVAEHAEFVRGMLDPGEAALLDEAETLARQFGSLAGEALEAQKDPAKAPDVARRCLDAVPQAQEFSASGANGLLNCQIKSVILPLLADHTLREANHYSYVLRKLV